MTRFRTLDDLDVKGKRVLLRVDLNVPMKDGAATDTWRIEKVAPTVAELAARGARIILLGHMGRPGGEIVPDLSLGLIRAEAARIFGRPVLFAGDALSAKAEEMAAALGPGEIMLAENLRFHGGEEENAPDFVAGLCRLGDLYVNDAFSCAHRGHASTEGLAHRLPAAAGRYMEAELEAMEQALSNPEHPVAAVIGGAKVSTKLKVLTNLCAKVDLLMVGGGMANTFLFAQGLSVGKSLHEPDMADMARTILDQASGHGCKVILPVDVVVAKEFKAGAETRILPVDQVAGDDMILDIGPETAASLGQLFATCRTLVWNGPLGAFEIPPFDAGTTTAARAAAELAESGVLKAFAGGGDTLAALNRAGVADKFTYVSSAGGAFLEWMEGRTLPGVQALIDNLERAGNALH